MRRRRPIPIDLTDLLDEAPQPWMCPECKRVFEGPYTTFISPIDGIERCESCAHEVRG